MPTARYLTMRQQRHSAEANLAPSSMALNTLWREKQLQYTWLRALEGEHADFWKVTGDSLDFTLEMMGMASPALRDKLMTLYLTLDPFPEVSETLRRLKQAGLKTAILSNGTPAMLQRAVENAKIGPLLDAVLSVEEVGVYKPHPRVYQLAVDSMGSSKRGYYICFGQRLGCLCGLGFRHARGLVQPLWPEARTPSRPA